MKNRQIRYLMRCQNLLNMLFNKSHAACYAVVAYRTAYLKTYYPEEFMAATLNSFWET